MTRARDSEWYVKLAVLGFFIFAIGLVSITYWKDEFSSLLEINSLSWITLVLILVGTIIAIAGGVKYFCHKRSENREQKT